MVQVAQAVRAVQVVQVAVRQQVVRRVRLQVFRASVASRAAQSNMSTNINSSRNATSQKRIVKQVVRNLYQDLIIPLLRLLHLIMISDWHQCISTILCFWIVMQHHNLNIKQQHHILQNNMTAKDKLYTITIKDKRDKEHLIVVPKRITMQFKRRM